MVQSYPCATKGWMYSLFIQTFAISSLTLIFTYNQGLYDAGCSPKYARLGVIFYFFKFRFCLFNKRPVDSGESPIFPRLGDGSLIWDLIFTPESLFSPLNPYFHPFPDSYGYLDTFLSQQSDATKMDEESQPAEIPMPSGPKTK